MTFFLLIVAAVCLAVSGIAVRRHSAPGATALVVLLVAVAEWNVAYAMEIGVEGLEAKLFWAKMQYFGIVATPPAILTFAAGYTHRDAWLTPARLACVSLIPLATLVVAWTQEAHQLMWSSVSPIAPAGRPLLTEHVAGFYPFWAYAYLLMFTAAVLLVAGAMPLRRYFRRQSTAIVVAFGMPMAGNLAYVLGPTPGNLDLTTVGFAVTALTLALACLRWGLLEIVPIARDALVEHMRDGMVVLDGRGRLVDCNPAVRPLLTRPPDEAIGRHVSEVLPAVFDALWTGPDEWLRAGTHRVEAHESEGHRIFEVEVVELSGGAPSAARLLLLHEVTAREQLQAHLARQALTDDLTKIGNRRFFLDRIQRALVDAARGHSLLAVVYVDLDDFKVVNDTYGHECGNAVLAATARRLEQCIRPGDEAARLGGDEFAVLLTNLDEEASAAQVADRIVASFRDPFELDGRRHLVSASMGLHVTDGAGCTPESLLRAADQRMYAAKRASHPEPGSRPQRDRSADPS